MNQATAPQPDKADVLAEAFGNAGRYLGLSQVDLGEIIGKDRGFLCPPGTSVLF